MFDGKVADGAEFLGGENLADGIVWGVENYDSGFGGDGFF